jgi:Flp pilus assembly protein TadD
MNLEWQVSKLERKTTGANGGLAVAGLMGQAKSLFERKLYAEAAELVHQAIELSPEDPDLRNTRGVFLRAAGRSSDAIWDYRQAVTREPGNAGIWSNMGNALADVKQLDTAIACHRRAIDLQPDNPEFYRNLARALTVAKRHREALEPLAKALRLEPANAGAQFDRAMAYLNLGHYVRGFADYEVRLRDFSRDVPGKRWKGQPYRGKRLVIVSEQGNGDAIWSSRYFRQVKALGGELVVECHEGLASLFSQMAEIDQVISLGKEFPEADFHCHTCSLAGLFTSSFDAIPAKPYITAPTGRLGKFAVPISRAGSSLRVGIVWSGNLDFVRNKDRAAPLRAFMQAFAHPGVQLYSLQKGPLERDLASLSAAAPIIDLAPYISDFADTAAAISELDLVIMTDSAIAHLSGALGKPVWVLLSYEAFWLWLDRDNSPWYPSMRFFRQQSWGDWGGVFDAASAELLRLSLEAAGRRST